MTTKLEVINSALMRCGAEPLAAIPDLTNKRGVLVNNHYDIVLRELLNDSPWNFATSRDNRLEKTTAPKFGFKNAYTVPSTIIRVIELSENNTEFRIESSQLLTDFEDGSRAVAITRSGAVATVTDVAHGFQDGELITFYQATQTEYNISATITYIDADHYSYAVSGTPATPATGAPHAVRDSSALRVKAIKYLDDPTLYSPSFNTALFLKLAENISYSLVQSQSLQQMIISEADRHLRRARSYNSQEGLFNDAYNEQYTTGRRL